MMLNLSGEQACALAELLEVGINTSWRKTGAETATHIIEYAGHRARLREIKERLDKVRCA